MRVSSNIDKIVVDLDLWIQWLDALHIAFPKNYNDPLKALNGFHEDWEDYCNLIKQIRSCK
jgi:hypothetical protein